MEKLKLNDKSLKIGNTIFNKDALTGMTKEEFKKSYKGILSTDLDEAWKEIKPFVKVKKTNK